MGLYPAWRIGVPLAGPLCRGILWLDKWPRSVERATTSEMRLHGHVFSVLTDLTAAAAACVARLSAESVRSRGRFTVAFSGGSLPGLLCPGLVAQPLRGGIDWPAWRVFWADERCVPATDARSNYATLREHFLDHVGIAPQQVYPMDATLALDPAAAAAAYQAALASVFRPAAGEPPRFDLILLGLGEDGHTASLFPSHSLLRETVRWVAPVFDSPKPPPRRITMTLPVLNNARDIVFMAAGAGKSEALARVLGEDEGENTLAAQLVHPCDGRVTWFVDEQAASRLRQSPACADALTCRCSTARRFARGTGGFQAVAGR